ncbi:MAG: putative ABC transporter permease [Clostridiales bacterium]|nr:putative ABC transporter permease [Clostridiales bacterium]
MTLLQALWFFIIYSFTGWVVEVIFHASVKGNIVNRGFLNGPVCPVYGFGMTAVLFVYGLMGSDGFIPVFLEGIIFTTAIELIAGFILDKCFHARWWDYSDMPLNLGGYICPAFSVIWGLAVVFAIKIAHKGICGAVDILIAHKFTFIILIFLYLLLTADTIVTARSLIGLNRKLEELDRIAGSLKDISDRMSDRIGNNALKTTQQAQEKRVQAALAKAELKDAAKESRLELEQRAEEIRYSITKSRHFGAGRMLNVFPGVRHRDYKEIINDLQSRLHSM